MNVLFSSCGRRVALVRAFRSTMKEKNSGCIIACDVDPLASALQEADQRHIVPPCLDSSFMPKVLDICRNERVDILVPLIDTELNVYASNKERLEDIGTNALVSDRRVIEICESKVKTASFFKSIGLAHLHTSYIVGDGLGDDIDFPAILKPDKGSGGIGVHVVSNEKEAEILKRNISIPVLQEMASGQEVTIDCLVARDGSLVRFVARERLEIRAGESSKGRTFKDERLKAPLRELFRSLKAFGPITVQCFREGSEYTFSEINPRFGGGYPLAHAAGADFPRLTIAIVRGDAVKGAVDDYKDGVYMTRFDEAYYLEKDRTTGELNPLSRQD